MTIKKETAQYLLHLLRAVLYGTMPQEKPEGISFDEIFEFAKFHSVECMAYYAIEQLEEQPEEILKQKWKNIRDQNIVKSFVQISEKNNILTAFANRGIDVLPLKGCLLKEMYPKSDIRQMSDLDILVKENQMRAAREELESLGYQVEHFETSNHDEYKKMPYMLVEVHREMLPQKSEYYSYYENVWNKVKRDCENQYTFHFSWDDYYLFLIVHFAKHYYSGGSGIRSIMDIYVFLKQHQQDLHETYLQKELNKLGLAQFREVAEQLADHWFADGSVNNAIEEMEAYVLTSGVYGTFQRSVENQIEKYGNSAGGKMRYIFSRTFLDYKTMCNSYPVLKTASALLPVFWGIRLISALIHKQERIRTELRNIFDNKQGK